MTPNRPTMLAVVVTALLLTSATEGSAQNAPFAALPGLTEAGRPTAAGIQQVCEQLAPSSQRLTGATGDLFLRCREMVQNSNQLQGSGPTPFSLGLSAPELAEAVNRIAPDEVSAPGTFATQPGALQLRLLLPRLTALRRGGGASLDLNLNGTKFAHAGAGALTDVSAVSASPATGGTGRLGFFLNGNAAFGDKDTTSREVGFDFYNLGVLGGVDYRFTDTLVLGVGLNYSFINADYHRALGDVDVHSYGIVAYGTHYRDALYVDAHAGFNWNTYDITRNILYPNPFVPGGLLDRQARGDTDGRQYTAGVGAGYDFRAGPVTITPFGRVDYLHLDVDAYSERGAQGLDLRVNDQSVDSFQSALGATVSYALSLPFGVLVPQVRGEWRHEFLNESRSITARYVNDPFNTLFSIPTDRPDRDFFALGAGLSSVLARGVSAFVSYETILGLRNITHHEFWVGARVEF